MNCTSKLLLHVANHKNRRLGREASETHLNRGKVWLSAVAAITTYLVRCCAGRAACDLSGSFRPLLFWHAGNRTLALSANAPPRIRAGNKPPQHQDRMRIECKQTTYQRCCDAHGSQHRSARTWLVIGLEPRSRALGTPTTMSSKRCAKYFPDTKPTS